MIHLIQGDFFEVTHSFGAQLMFISTFVAGKKGSCLLQCLNVTELLVWLLPALVCSTNVFE